MDCADEVAALKREVGPVVGGDDRLAFDLLRARMTVRAEAAGFDEAAILAAVARTGMRAEKWVDAHGEPRRAERRARRARILTTAASGVATAAGFLVHAASAGGLLPALRGSEGGSAVPSASAAIYAVAAACGLSLVVPRAWLALRRLRPDMNLLMTVAVVGAAAIGQWLEAATVSCLFSLSLLLESWSVGRARRAVERLLDLSPPRARVVRESGREDLVPVDEVAVASRIVLHPGERIPLDGRVLDGETSVDEAPITGESLPVDKRPGDEVFAGTINGDGVLTVEVDRPARDTVLARIIRMVGEAQDRRAPVERWVDAFARAYTPAVMVLAAATLVAPPLLLGQPWGPWVYRSLVLLVIACPCALVISTPVSIVAALAAAARHGVLVKGGAFIEAPARIRAVALDKTGTVTEGRQRVVGVEALEGRWEREVLETVAALEARSEHPIGRAIAAHAEALGLDLPPAEDARAVRGKGISGKVGGRACWAGSHRFLEEQGAGTEETRSRLDALAGPGRTIVTVGDERGVLGFVTLLDRIRPGARRAIEELRSAGIERIVMLTGDNRATAEAVAREAGLDETHPELLPEDKVRVVEDLVRRFGKVAMVGDGVNDAPAMARAGVGIAMGAAGSDAAIEAADVALMSDDLERIPWLVRHSRRALLVVRQNIAFALGVKAVFVALTYLGHASLWAAIAGDMGASLLVIGNGLRLLREPRFSVPALRDRLSGAAPAR
ncbi:MAG: cadmium-translocating P-type ATPase, partial [Acidobacteriia bacterium]|nr:cadmium-translocating P-type ATPase [Terriglobia bacterium]